MRSQMVSLLAAGVAVLWWTDVALGQGLETRAYIGVLAGPYHTTADHVSGTLSSVGVTGGVRVLPWLDVEVDVLQSIGLLTREYTGPSIAFPGSGPVATASEFVVTRFIKEREGGNTISLGMVFHPRMPWRRLSPRVFAGVSSHRTAERTVYEQVSLPPGVTLEQVNRVMPQEDSRTRHLGGPSVGGSMGIALTQRLWIVPDVRYDYGSIGDEINNALRTSMRLLWRF
jgi:hypothetical protein